MRTMHEYLSRIPFDLYELLLFHLVVKHRNFTKAAEIAGLTQSAITRQMQGIETNLGITLLERTTRTVRPTPAGDFLFAESTRLLGDVDQSIRMLREQFAGARKIIRVGVSRTIGLAYLPGFFHANLRRTPEVGYRVQHESSSKILTLIETNELDAGIICPPARLPEYLRITHRFEDASALAGPAALLPEFTALRNSARRDAWLLEQKWLLIEEATQTGRQLRRWMHKQALRIEPLMQLDNFDLIINLVTLGMGFSFVPIRALALYGRKRALARYPMPVRFERELVVVVRKRRKMPEHLIQFVDNVLF